MNKTLKYLFLFSLCSLLVFTGCRRKPVEVQTETETETIKETETEKQTEKATEKQTEKVTEKQTEKQVVKQSEQQTTKQSEQTTKQTEKQITPQTEQKTSVTPNTQTTTTQGGTDTCPYCYGSFSTTVGADGTSEYSSHVAQEESYIEYMKSQGLYQDPSTTTGTQTPETDSSTNYSAATAQCPYCGLWYSTDSTYGYSDYSQHVAAEEASSYQQAQTQYYQCPYCGIWADYNTYQDHITYGY